MRIAFIIQQGVFYSVDDREVNVAGGEILDPDSLFTEHGWFLPLTYSSWWLDIMDGAHSDSLVNMTTGEKGVHVHADGTVHILRMAPKAPTRGNHGINWARQQVGPTTQAGFGDGSRGLTADMFMFALHLCEGDRDKALELFASVLPISASQFRFISIADIQAGLASRGFTDPIDFPERALANRQWVTPLQTDTSETVK